MHKTKLNEEKQALREICKTVKKEWLEKKWNDISATKDMACGGERSTNSEVRKETVRVRR